MTAYERLNRVLNGKAEYQRLCSKVEELETIATKVTPVLSLTPKGGGDHQTDDTWATLADYKSLCLWQLKMYLDDCNDLDNELDCIRNIAIRTAMKYKYIDGLTIEEISERMKYHPRSIDRYLQTGRRLYERYYKEEA